MALACYQEGRQRVTHITLGVASRLRSKEDRVLGRLRDLHTGPNSMSDKVNKTGFVIVAAYDLWGAGVRGRSLEKSLLFSETE